VSDSFEDVLAEALAAHELDGATGFERVARRHPAHAERLHADLARLDGAGLLRQRTQLGVPAAPARQFPEQLGEFRLLRRLGGGGMGVVYLAEQGSLGRRVALKLVRAEHLYFPGAHDRFRREVEAIAKLQHPGIVPVFTAGEDAGVPWLAMEHVEGASLDQVLQRLAGRDPARLSGADLREAVAAIVAAKADAPGSAASPPTATPLPGAPSPFTGTWAIGCLRIVSAVAAALQHAHERGVLHRDVKPSNVMLTADGRALLLDFGLAHAEGSTRLTGTGSLLGSPAYMSPEQVRGDPRRIDARTDVYSLGVTLYELLTLRMPFAGESAASTRELVLAGRVAPLRLLHRTLPRDADVVCRKAMDVDAARRYPTVAAFGADLDNVLALRPIAARPPGALLIARRWAQRHPARATAAVAAVLLLVVAPAAFLWQQQAATAELLAQQQAANQVLAAKNAEIAATLAKAREQRDRAREAVDTMLLQVGASDLFELPRMLGVRRNLLASARSFYERFLAEATDDAELQAQAGNAALRLAMVLGDLGQLEQSLAMSTRAEALARTALVHGGARFEDRLLLLDALTAKGGAQQSLADLPAAQASFAQARDACEELLRERPRDPELHCHRLDLTRKVALVLSQLERHDEATALYRDVATNWPDTAQHTEGTEYEHTALHHVLCAAADEASFHVLRREAEPAQQAVDRAEQLLTSLPVEELPVPARLAVARLALASARLHGAAGDGGAAEAAFRDALSGSERLLRDFPDHANSLRLRASVLNDLALLLDRAERQEEATPLYDEAITLLRRLLELDPRVAENRANLAASLVNRGVQFQEGREPRAALTAFEEALALGEQAVAASPTRAPWRVIVYNAQWFVAQVRGELGDHAGQTVAAQRLAELQPDDGRTQRIAAGLLADAIRALAADTTVPEVQRAARRQQLEQRAMELLQRAAAHGCTDHEWLATSDQFAALRTLPGFGDVLTRVAANARHDR
jgi:serine/threonine protein kinase/tetratricopeptide (TPR) repeat protein